jgi:branched-chain amino acid transport system ATP-binding protein
LGSKLLLRVEDLQGGYGHAMILRGVSLSVDAGEVVSVLGANGAGKTTLLRAISGLLPGLRGQVTFGGSSLAGKSAEARARAGLGHVPEGRGIFRTLSVGENFRLGELARPRGSHPRLRKDRDDILNVFPDLAPAWRRSAGSLSGGQQQMLALARALITLPRLLMVDELSFGLSPKLVNRLFDAIRAFQRSGHTFLLVEQSARVLEISTRTYVVRGGQVVLEANSADLISNPALTASYMGTAPTTALQ